MSEALKIALIGNPNSGKTSVFNRLTGLNQQVGNFPGVTVDKKVGKILLPNKNEASLIDLPGTYSLYPNSDDERVVLNVLLNEKSDLLPDTILYVADATNLERHLILLTQIMDFGIPIVLLLNMNDLAESEGKKIDPYKLSDSLGVPVVSVNGRTGSGIENVGQAVLQVAGEQSPTFLSIDRFNNSVESAVAQIFSTHNKYRALLIAHNYSHLNFVNSHQVDQIEKEIKSHGFDSVALQFEEIMERYENLHPIMENLVLMSSSDRETTSAKADKILTHPLWGSLIFLGALFFIFQAIFSLATYPMDWIDAGMTSLIETTKNTLPQGMLSDFITDGVLAGIGGIVIFVPQITILFTLISILEETGYMARAVFLSDHLMRKFGLNGRSIVALISGAACAVPAVMSTRTISNWKERLITIFVTPFISCSARIPVYAVLVGFAVPSITYGGVLNLQGMVMMGLYLLGVATALFSSWVLKKLLKSKDHSFLMMELPTYKMPYYKNIGITVYQKVSVFVFSAGKIILVISMILWVLASYGPGNSMEQAERNAQKTYAQSSENQVELDNLIAAKKMEASYAGILGKFIEPAIQPLGFDWKIGIALITSFAAREVFIGTMATIYSVGSDGEPQSVIDQMKKERNPLTGALVYNSAVAFSLLVFYVLAMQCMSTLAIVKRETNSWFIPMSQLLYMTGLAYALSFITFQILS